MLGRLARRQPEETRSGEVSLSQMLAWRYQAMTGATYSPVAVDVWRALAHSASYACIDLLASAVSVMDVDVLRRNGRIWSPEPNPPPIIANPSALTQPDVWRYQVVESMCEDGNAFGLITSYDRVGRPATIETLDPERVGERLIVGGVPQITFSGSLALPQAAGVHQLYPHGDVWHVPGKFVRAGWPFGLSPIKRAQAAIGAALAASEFGARFFGDGGHPNAIVESDTELSAEQAAAVKEAVLKSTRGNREPLVMGAGLHLKDSPVSNADSQFLDLQRFILEEACRFWRVPPQMVYAATSGQSITYANVSQADLSFMKWSLDGYLVRFETAMTSLTARPLKVCLNRDTLLRVDVETRTRIDDVRLKNRTRSVNDVHAANNEPLVDDPEYDKPGIPGMAPGATPVTNIKPPNA